MTNEQIAYVCNEVNRAYCESIGDKPPAPWDDAPEWQKSSLLKGVAAARIPGLRPGDSHQGWMREKAQTGWRYGPIKDLEKKEHPCMVPFEDLPKEQQLKDVLFLAVVRVLCE